MNKLFSIDNYQDKDRTFGFAENKALETVVALGVDLTEAHIRNTCPNALKAYGFDSERVENYSTMEKAFETAMFRYVFQDDTLELNKDTLKFFKKPNPLKTAQRERYYEIIESVITTITPAVTSMFTGMYNEIKNIGYGDTAQFDVESNEILIVNKSAEGVTFGGEQHKFNTTKTVETESLNISFSTDWYAIAAGKSDFGKMFFKAGQGFANYFTVEAYNKLYAMALQVPASYKFTGFTTENIDLATMAVEGANGGVGASIIGTLPAVREVVPSNDFFKLGIGEEWVKVGYIGNHAGSPVVKIGNLINPTTINSNTSAGTPSFLFRNDVLFVMPFVNAKPVKTVFEGDLFQVSLSSIETSDKTERASLTYKAGVDYVYDTIIALITKE
jgi:hypothetical protein